MKMKNSIKILSLFAFLIILGCESAKEDDTIEEIVIETPDWTEATHSNLADPDYTTVFPQDAVQRLDIVITSTEWAKVQSDLASMPKTITEDNFTPVWVTCELYHNGKQWYKTGIRVKGNSSLTSTYSSGIKKFSFKLDFDQYEDTYPAIKNQRFYGFKQLNLNNNYLDKSLMREKVAGDLFREYGLVSAKSSFCEVYIDTGSGSQYFGLYTLVEEVDDTVIKTQFTSNSGNLYKPDGTAATFASGSYNTSQLYKKTNEEAADYTDIKGLYDAVNSSLRTSSPEAWRTLMNSKIDMDLYLKYLAANTVIQNWDTYGKMTHNFYLYNDPSTSKLVWLPWDNNESLQTGNMGGAINLNLSGVSTTWPLINYIAADATYYATYKQYAKEFATTVFAPTKMTTTYTNTYNLIYASAAKEVTKYTFLTGGISDLNTAVTTLKTHVSQRSTAASSL